MVSSSFNNPEYNYDNVFIEDNNFQQNVSGKEEMIEQPGPDAQEILASCIQMTKKC